VKPLLQALKRDDPKVQSTLKVQMIQDINDFKIRMCSRKMTSKYR